MADRPWGKSHARVTIGDAFGRLIDPFRSDTEKPMSRRPRKTTPSKVADQRPQQQRLQRLLASAGFGSRRQCEELIEAGRVEVDGEVVTKLGTTVDPANAKVFVDGVALKKQKLVYYAVNKPIGVVTTNSDPHGRPRVVDLVPKGERVFPVGRLDRSSEGLILLTNDGDLAQKLTHPKFGVRKVYRVTVAGRVDGETMKRMRQGIYIAEGHVRVEGAKIFKSRSKATELEIVLREGKNREIRRILARLGHKVLQLRRIAVGPLRLGVMPPGSYRIVTREEVRKLQQTSGPSSDDRPSSKRRPRRDGEKPSKGRKPTRKGGKKSQRRGSQQSPCHPHQWRFHRARHRRNPHPANQRKKPGEKSRCDRAARAEAAGLPNAESRRKGKRPAASPAQPKLASPAVPRRNHAPQRSIRPPRRVADPPPRKDAAANPPQRSRPPGNVNDNCAMPKLHADYYADSMQQLDARIERNDLIGEATYLVRVAAPSIAAAAVPGQFVMIRLKGIDSPLIGRAFAVYDIIDDAVGEARWIDLVYLRKGSLTQTLAEAPLGTEMTLWGPLGNGFSNRSCERLIMAAGGIGQTPMLILGREALGTQQFGKPARQSGWANKVELIYGARRGSLLAGVPDFREAGFDVSLCTDDGSEGQQRLVPDLLEEKLQQRDPGERVRVVTCGPEIMMEKVAELCLREDVDCQVSMETPMACGIGICFSCVAQVRQSDPDTWDYKRTCVEGPIFDADRICW